MQAELIDAARSEWNRIAPLFPGVGMGGQSGDTFFLFSKVGRWESEVSVSGDGLFCGCWRRYPTGKRIALARRFSLDPLAFAEETFDFEPNPSLEMLLRQMGNWLAARRDPATWHGHLSQEAAETLQLARSRGT